MAKKTSRPPSEPQKLTEKNVQYGIVVNVNDEVVPGFKIIQNVNPNKILKGLVPRPGIATRTISPFTFLTDYFPTALQASNQDEDEHFYLSALSNLNKGLPNNMGRLVLTHKILTPLDLINPASLYDVNGNFVGFPVFYDYIKAFSNTDTGVINYSDFIRGYVGAEHGFKIIGSNHNWGVAIGMQLNNKVPITKATVKKGFVNVGDDIILNSNAMIFKRYENPNSFPFAVPCVGTIHQFPAIVNTKIWSEAFVQVDNFTIKFPEQGLLSGKYEYAIEWVDNQGFAYNPGSYDPAALSVSSTTVLAGGNNLVNVGLITGQFSDMTYDNFYSDITQNTRFLVNLTSLNPTDPAIIAGINPVSGQTKIKPGMCTYYVAITVQPPFDPTGINDWKCNIYRRTLSQINPAELNNPPFREALPAGLPADDIYPYVNLGNPFIQIAAGLVPSFVQAQELCVQYIDQTQQPVGPKFDSDYYIPRPADMDEYMGHLIAVGDPLYKNFIFPSRAAQADFRIEDAFQVAFPAGDFYFTACKTLNDSFYAFSNRGTWLVKQISATAPYFTCRPVSLNLGCITTSRGIVRVGDRLLVPTLEGLKWFDGNNFFDADGTLNNIWNNIDITQHDLDLGGQAPTTVGHVPAFEIEGTYDNHTKQVIYIMPKDTDGKNTIYQLDTVKGVAYLFDPNGSWKTYDNNFKFKHIFDDPFNETYGMINQSNTYIFDNTKTDDNGVSIATILESIDVNFGERTNFQAIRFWGTGKLNEIVLYVDRETNPSGILPEHALQTIALDTNGPIGIQIPLHYMGNYFRWKITSTDPNFSFKGFEIVYKNSGIKQFKQID